MLGSPNLYRGNAPLTVRLRIHDLHAQLAPLERYGVGAMSFALTGGIGALVRGFGGALRGAFCRGADNEIRLSGPASSYLRLAPSAVILSVAFSATHPIASAPMGAFGFQTCARESFMPTVTTKDGLEIFYKDWGQGQPIVFSHGWPLSADDWDAQMLFFLAKAIASSRMTGAATAGRARPATDMTWIITRTIWPP